jgi:hydroxymethylglutaryl-CoA reductase (NADPH)
MPLSKGQAIALALRLRRLGSIEDLAARLAPTPESARPIPPEVPAIKDPGATGREQRLEFLRARGVDLPHLAGRQPQVDPNDLIGNIEQFIGMTQIPTGVIGPLRVNGFHAHGDFYVPLATSEGALVASYQRGARLITRSGGASCLATLEQVQRAPGFVFESIADAGHFAAWATGEFEHFQEIAKTRTHHGKLIDLLVHMETRTVYLMFAYYTADASGQNMATLCTDAICEDIVARTPVAPRQWFIESNLSGDKKATALSFMNVRGRKVMAEVTVPRTLVESVLHTTPERVCDYWRLSFIAGVQSGSIGVTGHFANGIAAMYLACGQDVACVSEAAVGINRFELTESGDLYCGVDLPNLISGTVGGGTRLPTAVECLRLMECEGPGHAAKFAEICAAVVLGGELSIAGALAAGDFARAHQNLGRPPKG